MAGQHLGLDKARTIYNATRHLKFSNMPPLDLLDRLSLLTIAAGLRPVGVLEGVGLVIDDCLLA